MTLLAGLAPVVGPRGWGFAAPEAWEWASRALARGRMLREEAGGHADRIELVGRGPVYVIPAQGESSADAEGSAPVAPAGGAAARAAHWVVRPYRRGGLVAGPLLGDRHLEVGAHRPVAEAEACEESTLRGISTPRVIAGAVYPARLFYRADLVTEYIAGSQDLAAALFHPPEGKRSPPALLLREAGRLIGRMAAAGVEHPDLNARNILLARDGEAPLAMLLDLDRCRLLPHGSTTSPEPMLRRLERSLRKIGRASGAPLGDVDLATLRASVERD